MRRVGSVSRGFVAAAKGKRKAATYVLPAAGRGGIAHCSSGGGGAPPLSPQFVSRPDPSVPAETVARAPLALLSLLSRERETGFFSGAGGGRFACFIPRT